MEMNEIRYFLAVAKVENIHRASEEINISPGSLSKAISKLEIELKVKLFKREGRNIKLTDEGRYLKEKGFEIIKLESSIRNDFAPAENALNITIAASEILLPYFAVNIAKDLRSKEKNARILFEHVDNNELMAKVRDGEVDLGISSYHIPKEFDQKVIAQINFNTYISSKHPLYSKNKNGSISVHDVLKYPFVIPASSLLGKISKSESSDGWRDDKFPRIIHFSSTSLKTIETLVLEGHAIAYLPDYYADKLAMIKLKIPDCPYHCKQNISLFTKDKKSAGWLNRIF